MKQTLVEDNEAHLHVQVLVLYLSISILHYISELHYIYSAVTVPDHYHMR